MLGLLLCTCLSYDSPTFQALPSDDKMFNFTDRTGKSTDIITILSNKNRVDRSYFSCDILVANSTFSNCWAFGAGLEFGSGGCIYSKDTSFYVENSSFVGNCASIGGALSLVMSTIFIPSHKFKTFFTKNFAFKIGGAIFMHSCGRSMIQNVEMDQNWCYEIGGAIHCSSSSNFGLEDSYINGSYAGHSAGALFFYKTKLSIFNTKFARCKSGDKTKSNLNDTSSSSTYFGQFYNKAQMKKKLLRYRGGGAIVHVGETMNTYKCCFLNNFVEGSQSGLQDEDNNTAYGNDMLFVGKVTWRSFYDIFAIGQIAYSIASSKVLPFDQTVADGKFTRQVFYHRITDAEGQSNYYSNCTNETDESVVITFSVPEPTSELPTITTMDISEETISQIPYIEATIKPTIIEQTPESTLNMPTRTIRKDVPDEQEFTVPPPTTPVETFPPTLEPTFKETPEETPVQTFKETPEESPVETIASTPFDSPLETLSRTEKETHDGTPEITFEPTPQDTHKETPESTPINTFEPTLEETFKETPEDTIKDTPEFTLLPTFEPTPEETFKETPEETIKDTPEFTLLPTFEPTPEDTIKATLELTPILTFEPTPQESPIQTPEFTPLITHEPTPFDTLAFTPNPTNEPTIADTFAPTFEPTLVPTMAPSKSLKSGEIFTQSVASKATQTLSNVSVIMTYSYVETDSAGSPIIIVTNGPTQIPTIIQTVITYSISVPFQVDGETNTTEAPIDLMTLIALIIGGLLLLLLLSLCIWFVLLKSDDSSTGSCVEMIEETVMQVPDSTSAPITNDNPLWTTTAMGDTDDPFRNDFEEEDLNKGFFKVGDNTQN